MNDTSVTDAIIAIIAIALTFMFLVRIWGDGERPYRSKDAYRRIMRRLRDDDWSTTYTHYRKKTKD